MPDASELPLSYQERERLKVCGVNYIISVFGRSLAYRDFRTEGHPNFDEYARGVMASELAPPFIREDEQLLLDISPGATKRDGARTAVAGLIESPVQRPVCVRL